MASDLMPIITIITSKVDNYANQSVASDLIHLHKFYNLIDLYRGMSTCEVNKGNYVLLWE